MIRIQGHRERRVGGYIRFLRIKKVPSATPAELCLLLLLRSHKNRPELCLSTERQSPPTGGGGGNIKQMSERLHFLLLWPSVDVIAKSLITSRVYFVWVRVPSEQRV